MKLISIFLTLLYAAAVNATCTDFPTNWEDSVKNTCEWYTAKKDLRCEFSDTLKSNLSAESVCCACGGGKTFDPHPNVGMYYIRSKTTGRYLARNQATGEISAFRNQNGGSLIKIEASPNGEEDENMYVIRFSNDSYLSFWGNKITTWTGTPGDWEIFEWTQMFNINGNGGVTFQNKKFKTYLTVTDSVGIAGNNGADGAEFDVIKVSAKEVEEMLADN